MLLPRPLRRVGYVVSVDHVDHDAPVFEHERFGVVPLADGVADGVGAVQVPAHGVVYGGVGPFHVPFGTVLRPSAPEKVVTLVCALQDVPSPKRNIGVFDAVVYIPGRTSAAPDTLSDNLPAGIGWNRSL